MYTIYYDSLTEAMWFRELNSNLKNANLEQIKKNRSMNPNNINKLLTYDKPDIILCYNNTPVLVLEITSEVPTGHNIGQRFARLVRAAENNVLSIYFFPFSARKHGEYSSICNCNARLFKAIENMNSIHSAPVLAVNWITDFNGELIRDGSQDAYLIYLINEFIKNNFNVNSSSIIQHKDWMRNVYDDAIRNFRNYEGVPGSILEFTTNDFIKYFKFNSKDFNPSFLNRPNTYVYKIDMSPASCKRQDPYTGMQFIYDYLLCRYGENVWEKTNNLVLYFPTITFETWMENNPNNPDTKSSNWYLTANGMLFCNKFYHLIP